MANEAEADWQAFRRYRIKGIDIAERPGRIAFSQMNAYSRKGKLVVGLLALAVLLGPTIGISMGPGREAMFGGLVYFFIALIPTALIMALGMLFVRRPTVLEITPGQIVIDNANEKFTLTPERMKNTEVRQEGQKHSIYVWDGPIPLYTFSMKTPQDAIAVKEGIMAAVRAVNGHVSPAVAASEAPAAPYSPPARNAFPE